MSKYKRAGIACLVLSWLLLAAAGIGNLYAPAAGASQSPAQQTCAAYRAWLHHKTRAGINAVIASTFTGTWTASPDKYTAQDAAGLYADVITNAVKYIPKDEKYLGEDC